MVTGMATPLPEDPGDDGHRAWLRTCFTQATAKAGATGNAAVNWGWRDRSISAPVTTSDGPRWLRVVAEAEQWASGEFWTGNVEAGQLDGIAKPQVLAHWEWSEQHHLVRAELMTVVPGRPCSPTPELRDNLVLPGTWWSGLHGSLSALAGAATNRTAVSQEEVTRRVRVFFGDRVDPAVRCWTVAHADLHWANLFEPDFMLADWEGWGQAPAGYDVATLYVHSLLQPAAAERVRDEFADLLEGPDGLLSQLYATARMLLRINSGDYADLAIPLHHNAERVIALLQG
jgi:hypothetical protein